MQKYEEFIDLQTSGGKVLECQNVVPSVHNACGFTVFIIPGIVHVFLYIYIVEPSMLMSPFTHSFASWAHWDKLKSHVVRLFQYKSKQA